MSKKIKVELTEPQVLCLLSQLSYDLIDLADIVDEGGEDYKNLRVMQNANQALLKGYEEWKDGK